MLTCARFSNNSSFTYPSSEQNLQGRFEQLDGNSGGVMKFNLADRVVNFMRARMVPDLLVRVQLFKKLD